MLTYKFRILLDNTDNEEIFRDIEINGTDTFESFYKAIIDAFFFKGDQMASFYVSNTDWDKGEEIALFDMEMDTSEEVIHLMSNATIVDFVKSDLQRFILVYDFLKMWCFLIELVSISDRQIENPEIILSIGISPDEDSRGVDVETLTNGDTDSGFDLGNDFDDIFSEFDDEDDFGGFENIDDLDI